ncbi:MAG: CRISPR system precrRNA processing endoribonuclease RAMP protein Cas6, partial [Bryobacteraceae bacterium]|nr:CRISPR system precrRNA processing endoribonuclease RAMP protein Cas6 [Bryobacteraceae bacterium]
MNGGTELAVHVTLIGAGVEHLPHFIAVFDAMGRHGGFGGRFRLAAVTAAQRPSHVVYDGRLRRMAGRPLPAGLEEAGGETKRARLEFVTPLRLRTGGRYNASPNFAEIAGALLRRIHFLSALYGDGPASTEWMHPLLAAADEVRTEAARFELFRWDRYSGRQQRRVAMDGVVGWLEASGEMDGLMPYLRLGEHLHVGSGTSMGMGRYRMEEMEA